MSSHPPSTSAPTPATPPSVPSVQPDQPLPPGYISVLCPPGFTASSMQEHLNARPLYARLIYRPL